MTPLSKTPSVINTHVLRSQHILSKAKKKLTQRKFEDINIINKPLNEIQEY